MPGEYERCRELQVARLVNEDRVATDTVRELLILSCHSSREAKQYFRDRLNSEEILGLLLGLAIEDYSGDAQMTAAYWVSQFPPHMLAAHVSELEAVASNEWDSVAVHAQRALASVRATGG